MIFLISLTLWVDTTGVEGESLQAAIDYLATIPGIDTVILRDGTYHLTINPDTNGFPQGLFLRDSIVFISENGAEKCTLSAYNPQTIQYATHVIVCDSGASAIWIEGFTISDASSNTFSTGAGAGIYAPSASFNVRGCIIERNGKAFVVKNTRTTVVFEECMIKDNASLVNAMEVENASVYLTRTSLVSNGCDYGAVLNLLKSTLLLDRVEFIGNVSPGGMIIVGDTSTVGISLSVFFRNWAYSLINVNYGYMELLKNVIGGNMAPAFWVGNGTIMKARGLHVMDNMVVVDAYSTADTVKIEYSNLFFNTFQPDTEIINNSSIPLLLENNYWYYTDSASIQAIINGEADFIPFEDSLISWIPSGPSVCDSLVNYLGDYVTPCDSVGDGDTLYLTLYGDEQDPTIREVCGVIITSSCYPGGILVTLLETDTSTGIYRGTAIPVERTDQSLIRSDDIFQRIGVNPSDTMFIRPLFLSSPEIAVVYNAPRMGIKRRRPVTFAGGDVVNLPFVVERKDAVLYDIAGRERRINIDGRKLDLRGLSPGIYFLKCGGKSLKIVKVK